MSISHDATNPSAQLAPAIDRERHTQPAGRRRLFGLAAGAAAIATTAAVQATATPIEAGSLEALWAGHVLHPTLLTSAVVEAILDVQGVMWPSRRDTLRFMDVL